MLSICTILFVAYWFDFKPKISYIANVQQQIQLFHNQIRFDQTLLDRKNKIAQDVSLLKNTVKNPLNDDTNSLLFKIFYLAGISNCHVNLVDPRGLKPASGEHAQTIELVLTGQLMQLYIFLYEVQQQHLMVLFTRIHLHHEIHDQWKMVCSLKAFLTKQPVFISKPARSDSLLTFFPIGLIHYAGQINDGHVQWALVKLPSAKILPVKIASLIGTEKLHILKINPAEQKIILENGREILK